MPRRNQPFRDGAGTCLNCGQQCDVRATCCRKCFAEKSTLICPTCKGSFDRSVFYTPGGHRRSYCGECHARWFRENRYLKKYGITIAEYEHMLEEQQGLCAICRKPPNTNESDPRFRKLLVDHDHSTGANRSLLCNTCNFGLGTFQDSIEVLTAAIEYLQRHTTALVDSPPPTSVGGGFSMPCSNCLT